MDFDHFLWKELGPKTGMGSNLIQHSFFRLCIILCTFVKYVILY